MGVRIVAAILQAPRAEPAATSTGESEAAGEVDEHPLAPRTAQFQNVMNDVQSGALCCTFSGICDVIDALVLLVDL